MHSNGRGLGVTDKELKFGSGDGLNARVKIVHEEGSSGFDRHYVLLLQNADPGSSSLEKQRCDTKKPFIADASPGSQILMTSLPKSVPDPVPQPVSNDPSVILHDDINDVTQFLVLKGSSQPSSSTVTPSLLFSLLNRLSTGFAAKRATGAEEL
ncbi:hypothetical protein ACOSQ2_016771 [Xanthoceras sorbifolium]